MYKKAALLIVVALVLGAASATQAEEGMLGRNEVSFAGTWAELSVGGASVSATLFTAKYGRFVTPNIEPQLGLFYAKLDIGGGGDLSGWGITPAVSYNFVSEESTNIVPYVGVGWYFLDSDDLGLSENGLTAFAGARFFVGGENYATSSHAFFLEYRYMNGVGPANVNSVLAGITNFF